MAYNIRPLISIEGSHPIVSRFMKGIFHLRMATPKYLVTWDVSVVLGYLKTFSPKNSLSLKQSTLKLAMLMALISFMVKSVPYYIAE